MADSEIQPLLVDFIRSTLLDAELKSAEDKFTDGAKKVMETSTLLNRLKQSIVNMMDSDQIFVETFNACTKQIHDTKDHGEIEDIKSLIDHFLMKQYLENSQETEKFLKTELRNFIISAEDVAKCIAVKNEMTNELKAAKEEFHKKAKLVFEKVRDLHNKHLDLLALLDKEIKKLDRKLTLARTLRKVVKVLFIGIMSSLFACSILAAAITISPGVAAAIGHPMVAVITGVAAVAEAVSPAIQGKERLMIRVMRAYESALEERRRSLVSMEAGTRDDLKGLDDITARVDKLIKMGNDPQLSTKLREFRTEIENLKETKNKCVKDTANARKKIRDDYKKLWK